MPGSKLTELDYNAAPTGDALLYIVSDPAGTPTQESTDADSLPVSAATAAAIAAATGGSSVNYTLPTHGVTRASTTMADFSTPWTDSVTVASGDDVKYDIMISYQVGSAATIYFALAVNGTIYNRVGVISVTNMQMHTLLSGVVTGLSAAAHTFNVWGASNGSETITVSSTVNTATSVAIGNDGVSSMSLQVVTAV